jgi:dihydrofolate synthase/folylpolyglutamate synthase
LALDSHPTGEQETEVHIRGLDLDLLIRLPSPAKFQVENAATAAATASALRRRGVPISDDAIRSGLERLAVAGRFEVVQRRPLVVLDGAHNPAGAVACREVLDSRFPDRAVTLVFAALADKDVDRMAAVLAPRARRIILTRAPGTSRAIPPDRLLEAFGDARGRCTTVESPDEAVSLGMSDLSEDGLLVVCGSLYLVGYVRKHVFAGVAV